MLKAVEVNLGPLKVYLGYDFKNKGRKKPEINEIYLNKIDDKSVAYAYFDKNQTKPYLSGQAHIGDVVATHWMGLELRVLDYVQSAKEYWDVQVMDYPTPLTTGALFIEYKYISVILLISVVIKIF